jgi:hypothetical protein
MVAQLKIVKSDRLLKLGSLRVSEAITGFASTAGGRKEKPMEIAGDNDNGAGIISTGSAS